MADAVYLRNMRPNRVVLQHAGLRVVLERRGSREDSVSLPAEALQNATIARWLRGGMIEQISKDAFLDLASRVDAYDPNMRGENEPALKTDIKQADLPMSTDPRTPTIIDTDKIDKSLLSPRLNYAQEPEPTENVDLSPQEVSVGDYHRGVTGRPTNLGDSPNAALIGEGERPNVLDLAEVVEKKVAKPAAKKRSTTKKKTSTKKSTKS